MEHISANGQITIVEGVELGPALRAELSTTENESVEHDQTEDESLELVVHRWLSFGIVLLVELADSTTQVSLQILRSLVRHLDGVLEDRLGNDFLVRETWLFRRDEASEVRVAIVFDSDFESSFEISHPLNHKMDILDHEPVTGLCGILEGVKSDLLLTLSHRNVMETLIGVDFAILGTDTLHIGSGVHTREQDKEGGRLQCHLVIHDLHVEGRLLDIIDSKRLSHILCQSTVETVRSESSEQQNSVE